MKRPGKDFREGFVAARFAAERGADAVRLLEPEPGAPTPDFALKLCGDELWFETTEIDRPNRRRGDDAHSESIEFFREGEWTSPEEYAAVTRERVEAKSRKRYLKCDGLVVWSNGFPIERASLLTVEWWRSAAEAARGSFAETWLHHDNRFQRLF